MAQHVNVTRDAGAQLAQGHAATLAEAQAAAEDALREVVEGNHE